MCNCISKHPESSQSPVTQPKENTLPESGKEKPNGEHLGRSRVEFVYSGATSLTAIGPRTQSRYRFVGPGARLWVDLRDAAALVEIPKLRRVF
jgi:hypothetical protein